MKKNLKIKWKCEVKRLIKQRIQLKSEDYKIWNLIPCCHNVCASLCTYKTKRRRHLKRRIVPSFWHGSLRWDRSRFGECANYTSWWQSEARQSANGGWMDGVVVLLMSDLVWHKERVSGDPYQARPGKASHCMDRSAIRHHVPIYNIVCLLYIACFAVPLR